MKLILLGAVLALFVLYPSLFTLVAAVLAALLAKPVLVAFAAGLLTGVRLPWLRRWAR